MQQDTDKKTDKVSVVTFGCRLNTYESEVMRGHAAAAGMADGESDVIIFNTCAVTQNAERDAMAAIRRARRDNPQAKIIVTGCAAQITPERYADLVEVDHVIGNDEKLKAETFTNLLDSRTNSKIHVTDIQDVKETAGHLAAHVTAQQGSFDGRARAFLQVQNGCDHRCTFCIIPYGRGPSRSVPIGLIVDECKKLVASGYQEIVLTGVDVTSYGADLPGSPTLGQMVRRLLSMVPDLKRLRMSSLDPAEIDEDMWQLIAHEPRLMPHLHLSLQSGDDMILKRMKRRHLRQDVIDLCDRARSLRPDVTFGADIIAGFPTETAEMFANTLSIIDECNLTWLHIFPYSPREGTPAAKMAQLPNMVRKERAAILREAGNRKRQEFLACHVGQIVEVLTENKGDEGHTPHFAVAKFSTAMPKNTLIKARVTGCGDDYLKVEAC